MLTRVKLLGFVVLNIVKLNAPSAFVAFLVILIVGGSSIFVFSNIHSTASPNDTVKFRIVQSEIPFFSQSAASKVHPAGTVSVTL